MKTDAIPTQLYRVEIASALRKLSVLDSTKAQRFTCSALLCSALLCSALLCSIVRVRLRAHACQPLILEKFQLLPTLIIPATPVNYKSYRIVFAVKIDGKRQPCRKYSMRPFLNTSLIVSVRFFSSSNAFRRKALSISRSKK
jgi:hypothetical protein